MTPLEYHLQQRAHSSDPFKEGKVKALEENGGSIRIPRGLRNARASEVTLGGRGDSFYEYLLKQWLLTNRTEERYKEWLLGSRVKGLRLP